ncbi:hypothetical protein PVV74_03765 [Roseovarius sp. SK2]|uniref:hypothetical protein n=1 Tax=Roseovarius TaxID=74030 RepID=UPI00237BDD46|nr:hypothetical protein [Roseovarius sp. SK2]MDD9724566.1 hypothetical protein [Roseovarius sp. SK2]
MKLFTPLFASLAITSLLTALTLPAFAQSAQQVLPLTTDDIEKFRSFNRWDILRNNTRGHCLGTKSDESGVVQIGMTADESMGYVGAFVKEDGAEWASNSVTIRVGNEPFTGVASGPVGNLGSGWHGGYVLSDKKKLRRALQMSDTVTAFPNRPYVVKLNIAGAYTAIYEILKCTEGMTN